MTPEHLAACLNLVASTIDESEAPSRTAIASDLRAIIAAMELDETHTAGLMDWLAKSVKKVEFGKGKGVRVKSDEEQKTEDELKKLNVTIEKTIPKLVKDVSNSMMSLVKIVKQPKYIEVLVKTFEEAPLSGGSEEIQQFSLQCQDNNTDGIIGSAGEWDDWSQKSVKNRKSAATDRDLLKKAIEKFQKSLLEEAKGLAEIMNDFYKSQEIKKEQKIPGEKPSKTKEPQWTKRNKTPPPLPKSYKVNDEVQYQQGSGKWESGYIVGKINKDGTLDLFKNTGVGTRQLFKNIDPSMVKPEPEVADESYVEQDQG
jgi:hypothetical protein